MARAINIEVLRLRRLKHTALLMAILALLLACLMVAMPGTQAQYASSQQDRHVLSFGETNSVGVSVTENEWWIANKEKGLFYVSGTVNVKEPTIENTAGDCYMRAMIRIVDRDGKVLNPTSNSERVNLIMGTLWSDPAGTNITTQGATFTTTQLQAMENNGDIHANCDSANFDEPVWNANMQAFTINYKADDGVFKAGDKVTLFNRVVIPADYGAEKTALMGEYYVVIWAQAIQKAGFNDATSALEKLSDNYVPSTIPGVSDE